MSKLVNGLIRKGYLRTDLIIDAFSEISRIEFVPKNLELEAESDVALPIGYGQTISQPSTVAVMMELLDPRRGHNILDVGSGSGWTTALLCYIVGREGRVTAVEMIGELAETGKNNLDKYDFLRDGQDGIAEVYQGDGSKGFKKYAPYDRILVSAASEFEIPEPLKDQLKIGGKMVIPVRNSLWYVERKDKDNFYVEEYPGFSFVPLVIK